MIHFRDKEHSDKSEMLLIKVLSEVSLLLESVDDLSDTEIHKAKSLLYAAVEKISFKLDRLNTVHRLLRELLAIVAVAKDARYCEKNVGLQIVKDLSERYGTDLRNFRVSDSCRGG